ncbi:28S ribosomal protein S17, mitochondrial [Copidosoma floridanum]|uniref:28S ribosomal protein S17, mitochondrial n=1 Tax=Copidosoma floridanum TaxID=29053 RepID=UPI0006C98074|nr:28S ribosomal protein S17, mitochondrial [Copidosoma floridanum]
MATTPGVAGVKQAAKYIIGKCIPSWKTNAVKVQIPNFEYDENLHMHFRRLDFCYAHDPDKTCKTGDLILIEVLPEKMTRLITHKVVEILFPTGNFVDPITGKKVAGSKYRDNICEVNEMYGKTETGFDYNKAPSRGSLEDKKDFTHKPSYRKYYEDPNKPQPYGI